MPPDSASAATLHLDLLTPGADEEWDRLAALLPRELAGVIAAHGGSQRRRALVATTAEGRPRGLAHLVSRPATAQAKLNALWTAEPEPGLTELLLAEAERLAAAEGAVLLKLEAGPATVLGAARLSAADYAALPPTPQERYAEAPSGYWKSLGGQGLEEPLGRPPYYSQTTMFTCGPACLGMALATLGIAPPLERAGEIQLWREATTVHAPNGPGGCDPFGLAVAAMKRGVETIVFSSTSEAILQNRAKTEEQRDLVRFVQAGFRREAAAMGARIETRVAPLEELLAAVRDGALVILLIDETHMHAEGAPHWILLHGFCGETVLASDPWIDAHLGESWIDASALAIPPADLDAMAWYGEPAYRCALVLRPPQ